MKRIVGLVFICMLLLPLVSAAIPSPGETLGGVFGWISDIFSLDFLKGNEIGMLRFGLWLMVFILIFAAGNFVPVLNRRTSGVIAAVLATATILLTPQETLIALFQTYTVVILTILIGAPIVGLLWVAYPFFGGLGWNRAMLATVRIILLWLCWQLAHVVTTIGPEWSRGIPAVLPILLSIRRKQ